MHAAGVREELMKLKEMVRARASFVASANQRDEETSPAPPRALAPAADSSANVTKPPLAKPNKRKAVLQYTAKKLLSIV